MHIYNKNIFSKSMNNKNLGRVVAFEAQNDTGGRKAVNSRRKGINR